LPYSFWRLACNAADAVRADAGPIEDAIAGPHAAVCRSKAL
jgi:hypothetical protein